MKIKAFVTIVLLGLVIFITYSNQETDSTVTIDDIDYRTQMRNFVIGISRYAKAKNPNFIIIPQNGIELVTLDGTASGIPSAAYLEAIDGNGQEGLFYGYNKDNVATRKSKTSYLTGLLNVSKKSGNTILVIDYCSTPSKTVRSFKKNSSLGYIASAGNHLELNTIPTLPSEINSKSDLNVIKLSQVKNFLYLINPGTFPAKADFIKAVTSTNYDLLIMDLFKNDTPFTADEIELLRRKDNGGKRLVLCYLSIGEAEDYRYYWNKDWAIDQPQWLDSENPDWKGNFKVKYWQPEWQKYIYGNDDSYMKKIIDAGFDGVYLDLIDAFDYYEDQ